MSYKVLVIDDDKAIVDMLKEALRMQGYETIVAFDGEEALKRIKEDNPDIIILDLILPKLNGYEVLKEIREKYKNKWIPVIIISAKVELESVQKCYSLEADHYLTKPTTIEKVLQGVETMVSLIPARKNE